MPLEPKTPAPTVAVEDYAKAIYALSHDGRDAVATTALAERLDVTPASASAMVKRLDEMGLARHAPYHGVELTDRGLQLALEVIRHHRLLALYLAEPLGASWAASWPAGCAWRWSDEASASDRDRYRRHRPPRAELPAAAGAPRPAAADAAPPRAGVRGGDRIRRPRQLRHQHRGWRGARLPPPVGDPAGEPDRDARTEPVRQGGHRDGPEPPRALPRAPPGAGVVEPLGAGRADRNGHRPRRVHRRRARAEPALRGAPVRRGSDDRRGRLRDPRPPAARLPQVRARDRRAHGCGSSWCRR